MELRVVIEAAHRTGEGRREGGPHEAAGFRQSGIHSARMRAFALSALLAAGTAFGAGAATITAPFKPDSGSIAVFCGSLIAGAPTANARDSKTESELHGGWMVLI